MSFGKNLQYLRRAQNMTQEQLAEKLDVSRQTISKWESDACYPEIDKLLQICSIFECTSDDILRCDFSTGENETGTAASNTDPDSSAFAETPAQTPLKHAPDKEEYDLYIKKFAFFMALGVFIVLLSVAVLLFLQSQGAREVLSVPVFLLLIAVAAVIFIIKGMELDRFKSEYTDIPDFYDTNERNKASKTLAYFISAGLFLVLCGIIFLIVTDETGQISSELAAAIFMLFIGAAAFLFVFAGIYHSRLETTDEKRGKADKSDGNKRDISGAIMLIATAAFLVLGFCYNLWHPGWVVFPVGGILCGVIECIRGNNTKN